MEEKLTSAIASTLFLPFIISSSQKKIYFDLKIIFPKCVWWNLYKMIPENIYPGRILPVLKCNLEGCAEYIPLVEYYLSWSVTWKVVLPSALCTLQVSVSKITPWGLRSMSCWKQETNCESKLVKILISFYS